MYELLQGKRANTYRGASDLTSFVLVKLWSKISAKSEIVQNTEKMTVFKGFKPKKRLIFGRPHATLSEHGMSVKSTVFEP